MSLRKVALQVLSNIASVAVIVVSLCQPVFAQQMPQEDKVNFGLGGGFFSSVTAVCSSSSNTALTGTDNPSKIWNFFRSKGLDEIHTAAVMANIQQESSFNPTIAQTGGNTTDPSKFTSSGMAWGIVQWDPGAKVIALQQKFKVTGTISELSTQLNIVWAEMSIGPTPAGMQGFLTKFNGMSTLVDATHFFSKNYEAAGVYGKRDTYASDALSRYGGSTGATVVSTSGGSCITSSSLSPDCTAATGSARILCASKAYDPASYQESTIGGHQGGAAWHASCPTINASCYVDCSGLVNMAIYDAFGADLRETTFTMLKDTKNWKQVSYSQVQAGDVVLPNTGHVEIIDHVSGSTIFTFGAHNGSYAQDKQVGPTDYYKALPGNVYLHYIGLGAS